uniref:G_PROTEIN_RECEP_F1_2 domain-containing protein n=1 Tax=Panagrellus redivivus TaxID=6233 RepID=A0A7E4VEG5_PANRE
MRKYRRILYQNCLLEVTYAVVSGISQTKVQTFGTVSLFTASGVPSATQSEANILTALWIFSLYAVIFFVPVQIFYRYLIIVRDVVITNKCYVIMLIPSFITVLLISGGYYATISLTPGCTSDIIEKLKLSNNGHDLACVPLVLTHPAMIVLLSVALTGMTLCFIFVPLVSYLVYKNLKRKASMTSSEKSVQRQVSFTLILQVCIIAITSLFPLGCILINMVLTSSVPWLSTIASATFSVLPVVNPILTMFTIRSYRRVLFVTARKVYGKKNFVSIMKLSIT